MVWFPIMLGHNVRLPRVILHAALDLWLAASAMPCALFACGAWPHAGGSRHEHISAGISAWNADIRARVT